MGPKGLNSIDGLNNSEHLMINLLHGKDPRGERLTSVKTTVR